MKMARVKAWLQAGKATLEPPVRLRKGGEEAKCERGHAWRPQFSPKCRRLEYLLFTKNTNSKRSMKPSVHSSIIYSSRDMGAT